ncbi:MAG: DUF4269 domain-containing protein, partial [Turicibacter sp.]
MEENFIDYAYLKKGNTKQKRAYDILSKLNLFEILKPYHPILVGTIPIEIEIDNSDLDIICEVHDFEAFKNLLQTHFSNGSQFKMNDSIIKSKRVLTVNFFVDEFEIEIYGENLPSLLQNGYRHMIVEHRLLKLGGPQLRRAILQLKEKGVKTEPAFAQYLGLEGN